jgi:hypothetical protein
MIGYKGFNKDWKCKDFQYEVGKTFKENVNPKICDKGLHFCEMPLDVFNYYEPINGNKFAMIEALGDIDKGDDKVATNKLRIDSEFSISDLFKWHFKLVFEKVESSTTKTSTTGDYAHSSTTGYEAHSSTTGNKAHSSTTGYEAHSSTTGNKAHSSTTGNKAHSSTTGNKAHSSTTGDYAHSSTTGNEAHSSTTGNEAHSSTTGDYAHSSTTGNEAHSSTTGDYAHSSTTGNKAHSSTTGYEAHSSTTGNEAISSSLGIKAKAKAIKGWIVIVDWQQKEDYSWYINEIYHAKVGNKILNIEIIENTYYWFEKGELKNEC